MALSFFGKNQPIKGRGYVPTDRIKDLAAKGFSEPEIIDILRKETFSPEEVDKGLMQALKISVSTETPQQTQQPQQQQPQQQYPQQSQILTSYDQMADQKKGLPELPTLQSMEGQQMQSDQTLTVPETSLPHDYYSSYSPEEYIDYLVSQRLTEMYARLQEVHEMYEELSEKMKEVKNQVGDFQSLKLSDQQTGTVKMDDFKNSMNDITARVAGLEKAFRDTLPSIVDSVKAVSEIVQTLRREVRV